MTTLKTYYTLIAFEAGAWAIAFGDYDIEVVEQEARGDYQDQNTKIISSDHAQEAIDAVVADINSKLVTIEIKRSSTPSKNLNRYNQDVFVDGALVGMFSANAWGGNKYTLRDLAGEHVKYTRKTTGMMDWEKTVEAYKIADMAELVQIVIDQGEMPDQAFIDQRQAKRDADYAASQAEQADADRVELIKDTAEEMLDVLFAMQQRLDEGKPVHGSVAHQELNAVIKKATTVEVKT
jgi:hypothetical protein|tara:strand:+ start:1047 stop:1754 length:708 start_codon:yes stop_codon:yes gene_type:complete